MAARVIKRAKPSKLPEGMKDKDLNEIFNQMLGTGPINMEICYPKFKSIKSYVELLTKTLKVFNTSTIMTGKDFVKQKAEIDKFIASADESIKNDFNLELPEYEWNLKVVPDDIRDNFATRYEAIKKCALVTSYIEVCNRLIPYRRFLSDEASFDYSFINTIPGEYFSPLPFSTLNIKYISVIFQDIPEQIKKFILYVLNKLLNFSYKLYKEISSPDVNVGEFAEVIMSSMKELKKRIPRCDRAFNKIAQSVEMLKSNFPDYYKDFIRTNSNSTIMESFIIDVSKEIKADPELMRQFKHIIGFLRREMQRRKESGNVHPKFDSLFTNMQSKFDEMDKYDNIKKSEMNDGAEDADETDDENSEGASDSDSDAEPEAQEDTRDVDDLVKFIEGDKRKN